MRAPLRGGLRPSLTAPARRAAPEGVGTGSRPNLRLASGEPNRKPTTRKLRGAIILDSWSFGPGMMLSYPLAALMDGSQKLDTPAHHHRVDNSRSKMTKLKLAGRIVDMSGDPEDPYFRAIAEVAEGFSALEAWSRANLPHNAVVIDAGGNIGITALLMSSLVPDGHVHVFEALPANVRHLRHNLEANGVVNCTVNAVALGHQAGTITMQGTGSSSHVMGEAATTKNGIIPMTTLDDYVATVGLQRLDFIKMDVEGFEPAVLQGAAATIERFRPPILMEFNVWCLSFVQRFDARNFGYSLWNAFDVRRRWRAPSRRRRCLPFPARQLGASWQCRRHSAAAKGRCARSSYGRHRASSGLRRRSVRDRPPTDGVGGHAPFHVLAGHRAAARSTPAF